MIRAIGAICRSAIAASLLSAAIILGCSERGGPSPRAVGEGLPYPRPPEGSEVPPAGSFAIRAIEGEAIAPLPGIPLLHGIVPQVFGVQIDYAGPKRRLEVFVENREGERLHSTAVVHSESFGAGEMKVSGNTTDYSDGEPHGRPRQSFIFRVQVVEGAEERNTHLTVFSFDSTEQRFAAASQSAFYTLQYDNRLPTGAYQPGVAAPGLDRGAPRSDDEAVEIFRMTKDGGRLVTLFGVRFR